MGWLIVCCDGTWNTPDMPSVTNVRRLYNLLEQTDTGHHPQHAAYYSGVGTTGSLAGRLEAGTTGTDLDEKILDAYRWLVTRYTPGDEIALFGFSRGAYTVRSLAGLIGHCGLIDSRGLDAATVDERTRKVYTDGYRKRSPGWRTGVPLRYDPDSHDSPVRFIGVWDTVGALGIPGNLGWLHPEDPAEHAFHDVRLDRRVPAARHAVALDEMRGPFTPALWDQSALAPGQDVRQVWFAGSHMDVGGGHPERGLPDAALAWMLDEAQAVTSIGFNASAAKQIRPNPLDVLHDDNHNQLGPGLSALLDAPLDRLTEIIWDSRPRAIPPIDATDRRPDVHSSVYDRQHGVPITSGPYRPTHVLANVGDTATVEVAATPRWNNPGLFLQPGEYEFSATGEWRDRGTWTGPSGIDAAGWNPLPSPTVALDQVVRSAARAWTGQDHPEWTLPGERRRRDLPAMRLVGVVANDAGCAPRDQAPPNRSGRTTVPTTNQTIDLGDTAVRRVKEGGYLYAYANDSWGSYDDNAGSVQLTVTKRS